VDEFAFHDVSPFSIRVLSARAKHGGSSKSSRDQVIIVRTPRCVVGFDVGGFQ